MMCLLSSRSVLIYGVLVMFVFCSDMVCACSVRVLFVFCSDI